ncbi:hypothetical protein V2S85_02515 [Novosphingobium resinovorum]|nr:hypothetical protein [Novosphingobium resinovorum]
MRLARQRQQGDTLIHIVVAGVLMPRQVALAAIQFIAPLRRHAPVEILGHGAVQLIDIHSLQPITEPIDLRPKARDRLVMVAPLDLEAVPERLDDKVVDFLVDPQLPQQPRELLLKNFLADELFRAFPVVAGAMIVDVFALLDLGRKGTTAMAAAYEAGEGELPHAAACLGMPGLVVAAVKNVLNAKP